LTFPTHVLQLSACLALEAFLALPGSSTPPFRTVVQGATETYSNFIDRLWDALMNHPDLNEESKQQIFRVLAFGNAKKVTKQLLASLPKGAGVEGVLSRIERAGAQKQQATVAAAVARSGKMSNHLQLWCNKTALYRCNRLTVVFAISVGQRGTSGAAAVAPSGVKGVKRVTTPQKYVQKTRGGVRTEAVCANK